jgi:mono/diheme cytochrome c family protein
VVLAPVITLTARAQPAQPPQTVGEPTSAIAAGAELYARHCQRCHNLRGPAERSDREWTIITQHMETRANMTVENVRRVRAFLLASNDRSAPSASARPTLRTAPRPDDIDEAMLAAGRQVFYGAGTCAACHGQDLTGTPIAPSLADPVWKRGDGSPAAILEAVRTGVAGTAMAPYPGGISDDQAVQAAAFVWAVSHGRTTPVTR